MGKSNPDVILLQNIKNRDSVLTGRFHADIRTVVFGKPVAQLLKTFGKGRKESFFVLRTLKGIRDADPGIDPSFVDIKSATVVFENFKRHKITSLRIIVIKLTVTGHPAKSSRLWKR